MKNFETRCPVDGTSALQMELEQAPQRVGAIIEFPGRASRNAPAIPQNDAARSASIHGTFPLRNFRNRIRGIRVLSGLVEGGIAGTAFDRVRPWQAVATGCLFSALTLATILMGS